MRRASVIGAIAAVVVLIVAAATLGLPYLTKDRRFAASVPQPPSVVSVELVPVKPRERACLHHAVVDTHSEVALFQVEAYGKPTVPLRFDVSADGYRASASIPASAYKDEGIVHADIRPPRRDVLASACITNLGPRNIALFATTVPERSAANATVAGRPVGTNPWLAFYEAKPTSIGHRLPTIFERMAIFRPPFIDSWLLWPLALLFAIGVPATVVAWYARSLSDDGDA
jgi:hypothetical protein